MKARNQNSEAALLLKVIKEAASSHRLLTYQTAAVALKRPKNHARAVAQVCDLLDAAAAFARVPLLALIFVRASSGEINRKAWTATSVPKGIRDRVIQRSLSHKFSKDDFKNIERALDELKGLGNHAAWKEVRRRIPSNELYKTLSVGPVPLGQDAIEDIGSDQPGRQVVIGVSYVRDPRVRKAVERRADGRCELCGKTGFFRRDGTRYIETHHIIALANDGADRLTNVLGLCADHHREAHFGARREELEREMITKVKALHP